jgi:hypothetical protein
MENCNLGSARVSRVGFGVSPKQASRKVREPETASPARETRALPRTRRVARSDAKKNAGRLLAIRHFDVQQQRLNCALIVVSSSLGFFRFQGLNGIARGLLHAL